MSERTQAPRSGGRTAGQHKTGRDRDADTRRSDGRGTRHFTSTGDDTRRSGMRRGVAATPATGTGPGKAIAKAAGTARAAAKATGMGTAKAAGTARATGMGTAKAAGTARATGMGTAKATGPGTGKATAERPRIGDAVGRGSGPVRGATGRRPVIDAPVDGANALDLAARPTELVRRSGAVAVQPRLRVAPPAPISVPRAPFVASMIGLVVVGVLGILLINTKTNENSFKIADLKQQNAALDNQQQDLQNQLVAVSSIGNLDAAARRLGLVKADKPALIRLPDGKLIGVLTPTNGRPAVTARDARTIGEQATPAGQNTGAARGVDGQAGTNGATKPAGGGSQVENGTQKDTASPRGDSTQGGIAPAGAGR